MTANGYIFPINVEAPENCQILNRVPHVLSETIMALSSDLRERNVTLQRLKEPIPPLCSAWTLLGRRVTLSQQMFTGTVFRVK